MNIKYLNSTRHEWLYRQRGVYTYKVKFMMKANYLTGYGLLFEDIERDGHFVNKKDGRSKGNK